MELKIEVIKSNYEVLSLTMAEGSSSSPGGCHFLLVWAVNRLNAKRKSTSFLRTRLYRSSVHRHEGFRKYITFHWLFRINRTSSHLVLEIEWMKLELIEAILIHDFDHRVTANHLNQSQRPLIHVIRNIFLATVDIDQRAAHRRSSNAKPKTAEAIFNHHPLKTVDKSLIEFGPQNIFRLFLSFPFTIHHYTAVLIRRTRRIGWILIGRHSRQRIVSHKSQKKKITLRTWIAICKL